MSKPEHGRIQGEPGTTDAGAASVQRHWLSGAWPYLLVLFVGGFILLPKLGVFGFWDPWEPKYAESVREMIELDSYIVPYYRYDVRLTKPILVYWGILTGAAVFGLNEFGARIVGVCMALGSMLGVYYAFSLLRGRRAGLTAAIVISTIPQFFFIARQAMPDVYLFTSLGSCLVFLALGLFGPDRRRNLHFGIAYGCFALAVLAKGPMVAGTVVLATLAVYLVAVIDVKRLWQPGLRTATLLLALAGALGTALFLFWSFVAFLFGTSSMWWGYSSEDRRAMEELRQKLLSGFGRTDLAEILLVLVLAAVAFGSYSMIRRPSRLRRWSLPVTILVGLAALVALIWAGPERKILVAALIAAAGSGVLVVVAAVRYLSRPELWDTVRPYLKPIGLQILLFLAVFVAIAGPWHVGIVLKQGHGYFTDFIVKHNLNRAVDKINSSGMSDYYLRVMLFGYFPWAAFIPIACAILVGWGERNLLRKYGPEVFLMIAALVTFAAFSASTTKFPHYLAPMVIPLGALIGLAVNKTLEWGNSAAARLVWLAAAMLSALSMLDLVREDGVRFLVSSFTVKRWVPDDLAPTTYFKALLACAFVLMLIQVLVRSRIVVGLLLATTVLMANYNTAVFIPKLSHHKTLKQLAVSWEKLREPGDPIGFHGDLKHGIFYYTKHTVSRLGDVDEFMEFMNPDRRAFCIMERVRLFKLRAPFAKRYPGHELQVVDASHFKYHLVTNFPVESVEGNDPRGE